MVNKIFSMAKNVTQYGKRCRDNEPEKQVFSPLGYFAQVPPHEKENQNEAETRNPKQPRLNPDC
jgi:hypothetical protein